MINKSLLNLVVVIIEWVIVIILGIDCLNTLCVWDQGLNPLFFKILPILRTINLWTRIWRRRKINPFLLCMSMPKKHFQTRLYYFFVPFHILSTCQVENVVGNVFWPNITLFLYQYNYFLYQPQLFRHILECSISIQGIPTLVP